MSLTEDERRAWGELERLLMDDFPRAPDPSWSQPWTLPVRSASRRTFLPGVLLVVGIVILVTGVLTGVPLFVIAGVVVLGLHIGRIHRRACGVQHPRP